MRKIQSVCLQRKNVIFFLLTLTGLSLFFFSFSSYLYNRQEEVQLFIPKWSGIFRALFRVGETSKMLGLLTVQFYRYPLFAAAVNGLTVAALGTVVYSLLQHISSSRVTWALALFPVFTMLKAHIQFQYLISGTYALLLVAFLLLAATRKLSSQKQLVFYIASVFFVYWFAGQLVVLYSILLVELEFILSPKKAEVRRFIPLVLAGILAVWGMCVALQMPITQGLHGMAYHEIQLQPDSFIYLVWFVFSGVLLGLLLITWLLKHIHKKRKVIQISTTIAIFISLFVYSGYCLPSNYEIGRRMSDKLDYLARNHKWEEIIEMHFGKKIPMEVNRNYLNLALAKKGVLGSRLFCFDQNGPQGLLTAYDHTFERSILLSDIHFAIGDISLSESYAMEALTLGRNGGSALAMQRLVQLSLIREEWKLAEKYITLLKQMPSYNEWALRYEKYLQNPELIKSVQELSGKSLPLEEGDKLMCLMDVDGLWNSHLNGAQPNRTAFEYIGCSYLLAKKNDLFKDFLTRTANLPESKPLPLHFQEAALMVIDGDSEMLKNLAIDKNILAGFTQFQQKVAGAKNASSLRKLYGQFGNTYWFYYNFKKNVE